MGISPGWGDIYTWDLPTQFIDITKNVPDGVYELASRSNFDGGIMTADRSQEMGITCIRITGTKVAVVKELPSQAINAPLPGCGDAAKPDPGQLARRIKIEHVQGHAHKYERRWQRSGAATLRAKTATGSATGAVAVIYRVEGKHRVTIARTTKRVSLGTAPRTLSLRLLSGAHVKPGRYVSAVSATIAGVRVRRAREFRLK
jgi:hypothetical protein